MVLKGNNGHSFKEDLNSDTSLAGLVFPVGRASKKLI